MADKELEGLELQYRHLLPTQMRSVPNKVTTSIREAALKRQDHDTSNSVIPIAAYRKKQTLWSSLSLAAGILLGVLISTGFLHENNILEPSLATLSDSGTLQTSELQFMGETYNQEAIDYTTLSATDWQRIIAELVLMGEIEQAEKHIYVFKKRFPDFETPAP